MADILPSAQLSDERSEGEKTISARVGVAVAHQLCSEDGVVASCIAVLVNVNQESWGREKLINKTSAKLSRDFFPTPWRSDSFAP